MVKKKLPVLTRREIEVLKLMCLERKTNEIALKLKITKHGVDYHRRNLYKKTKSKSLLGLFKYAIKQGFITHGFFFLFC